jgi:hypothetical protein
MPHKRPKWAKETKCVTKKVIYLSAVRLARKLDALGKAKDILDDHDRAKMWDAAQARKESIDRFVKLTDKPDDWEGNDDDR